MNNLKGLFVLWTAQAADLFGLKIQSHPIISHFPPSPFTLSVRSSLYSSLAHRSLIFTAPKMMEGWRGRVRGREEQGWRERGARVDGGGRS